jgi:dTDP-4-amino-4,6-dideoxygalactose transaminase
MTEATTGILAAHTLGRRSDVRALTAVGRRNGIPLIVDSAPALGATVEGVFVGSFGRAEIVSFHAQGRQLR